MSRWPIHLYNPCTFVDPPRGVYTPICPHTPVLLYVLIGFCMLWGVIRALLHVGHLLTPAPVWGCLPICYTPTHSLAFLCISMFWGYLHEIWGIFPLCWRFGGCSPSVGGFGGISTWGVHMLFLYILLVCCSLLSHISTMATTTTPPVMVLYSGLSSVSSVTVAPSLMGLPATLGQCEVVQPPPLMLRGSGSVIGPASVPQQQLQSSMPLQAYANYAMGFPRVVFFFRVEPPTILFIIYWCLFWCLLSTFRCQVGCHIHLWGCNH